MSFPRYSELPLELRQMILTHHLLNDPPKHIFATNYPPNKFIITTLWISKQLQPLLLTSKCTLQETFDLIAPSVTVTSIEALLYHLRLLRRTDRLQKVRDVDLRLTFELGPQSSESIAEISALLDSHSRISLRIKWTAAFVETLPSFGWQKWDSPERQEERAIWKMHHELGSVGELVEGRTCKVVGGGSDETTVGLDLVPIELLQFAKKSEVLLSHATEIIWFDYMLGLYIRNKA